MPRNWRREKIQGSKIKEEEKKRREKIQGSKIKEEEKKRKDSRIRDQRRRKEKKRFKDQRRAFARIEAIEELTIGNLVATICAFQYIVYGPSAD